MNITFGLKSIFKITLLFMLIFGLSACDFIDSIIKKNDDANTKTDSIHTSSDVGDLLVSSNYFNANMKVAMYCQEDGNDPFQVYDFFDHDLYTGYNDSLHAAFSENGKKFTAHSLESKSDKFIVKSFEMNLTFSDDFKYIESIYIYNRIVDLYYVSNSYRDLEFEYIIGDSIPIITANVDSIEMNNAVTYYAELVDSAYYDFRAKEMFPEIDPSSSFNYFDTKGQNRYLEVKIEFPLR